MAPQLTVADVGLEAVLSDSRRLASPLHTLPQEACPLSPGSTSFCHLRAALDDGLWLRIQGWWRPKLGGGVGGG